MKSFLQMFYQYEYVKWKEVHDILASNGSCHCDEKSGWVVLGTDCRLRESFTQNIKELAGQKELEVNVPVFCFKISLWPWISMEIRICWQPGEIGGLQNCIRKYIEYRGTKVCPIV